MDSRKFTSRTVVNGCPISGGKVFNDRHLSKWCSEVERFAPNHLVMFLGGNDGWGLFESLYHVKPDISDDRDLESAYLGGGFVPAVLGVADRYLESLGVQRLSAAVDRYLSAIKITDAAPSSC